MDDELKRLLENAQQILITSHIAPDPDAICSVLLLGTTLKTNYPDKEIIMTVEEEPEGVDFLEDYRQIEFKPLLDTLSASSPDLLVILDANNFGRCSRFDGDKVRDYVVGHKDELKTVIIDHHEPDGQDPAELYINQGNISATQDVYEICFEQLELKKPANYGELTMLGIYSDSGGFVYPNPRHNQTSKIVNELLDEGVDLERIVSRLTGLSSDHMSVIAELAANLNHQSDYSYSFVSDDFTKKWLEESKSAAAMGTACSFFVGRFIRIVDDRVWGFIVYPNILAGFGQYSVSLRAESDSRDVAAIARELGGGGHKPAAGAKFVADDVQAAVTKVQQVINR